MYSIVFSGLGFSTPEKYRMTTQVDVAKPKAK